MMLAIVEATNVVVHEIGDPFLRHDGRGREGNWRAKKEWTEEVKTKTDEDG